MSDLSRRLVKSYMKPEGEPEYQREPPTPAQARCPHRIRNRDNTECSICGSRKKGSRWEYLTLPWFNWFTIG